MHFDQIDVLASDATVNELLRPPFRFLDATPGATELSVNRPGEVFVKVGAEWHRHNAPDMTLDRCLSLATAIATYTEQEISPATPILSAIGGRRIASTTAGVTGSARRFCCRFLKDDISYETTKVRGAVSTGIATNPYQNTTQTGDSMAKRVLASTINIKPSLYKNQGNRASICVARDMNLSTVYALKAY